MRMPTTLDSQNGSFSTPLPLSDCRVLLVTHREAAKGAIMQSLQNCGAIVFSVESVRAGAIAVEHFQPNIIITALQLSDGDGYLLLRQVQERVGKRIPAIAIADCHRNEDRKRLLTSGFQRYLAEPIEVDRLIGVVASLTDRN